MRIFPIQGMMSYAAEHCSGQWSYLTIVCHSDILTFRAGEMHGLVRTELKL